MSWTRVGIFLGLGALMAISITRLIPREPAVAEANPPPRRRDAPGQRLSTEDLVERTLPSVVSVEIMTAKGREGIGAGFVVGNDLVATNFHVIDNAISIRLLLADGRVARPSRIIGPIDDADLVLLEAPLKGIAALELRDREEPRQGEAVIAIGHPLGLHDTVTEGIVSGFREGSGGRRLIQTSAAISKGNSGGPLVDYQGRVVGVMTSKVSAVGVEGLNFAMPAAAVAELLDPATGSIAADDFFTFRASGVSGRLATAGLESREGGLTGLWRVGDDASLHVALRENFAGAFTAEVLRAGEPADPAGTEEVESLGDFALTRQADGTWTGMLVIGWSCAKKGFVRDAGGSFRNRTVTNECTIEHRYTLRESRTGVLEGQVVSPRVPDVSASNYVSACATCLEDEPLTTAPITWVRVGSAR